jgi:hypothetical protein
MQSEIRREDREDSRAVEDMEDIEDNANAATCLQRSNTAYREYEDDYLTQHRNAQNVCHWG